MATLSYQRQIMSRLTLAPETVAKAIATSFAQDVAPRLAETVKSDHPWVNQTGRLEASIQGYVNQDAGPTTVTVGVGYDASAVSDAGFPYGARLENDYAGAYAILRPTLLSQEAGIIERAIAIAKGKA